MHILIYVYGWVGVFFRHENLSLELENCSTSFKHVQSVFNDTLETIQNNQQQLNGYITSQNLIFWEQILQILAPLF